MAEFSTKIAGADPWGRMPGGQYYQDWGHPSGQIDWSQVGQTIVNPEDWYGPNIDRAGGPFVMTEPLGTTTTPTASDFESAVQDVPYPGTSYQASGLGYVPYQSATGDTSTYPTGTPTTGTANYNYGTTGGNMAYNYQNPTSLTNPQNPDFYSPPFDIPAQNQPFPYENQRAENEAYLQRLTGYLQEQEQMPDLYSRLSGQLNLPTQREYVANLGEMGEGLSSQIKGLPENVALTSRESTMTSPQQQRVIESRQEPLMKQYEGVMSSLKTAGARLTMSEQEMGKRMEMELAKQQMNLLPFEKDFDLMSIMQAREFVGYTNTMRNELDRLINNQQTGAQWTNAESQRAHELAVQEQAYQNQLSVIDKQFQQQKEMYDYQYGSSGVDVWSLWG